MIPLPRGRDPILLFLLAALLAALALRVTWLPDWLRAFLMLCAIVFGAAGALTGWNWIAYNASYRIRELSRARVAGSYLLSTGLHGLTIKQTDLVARHDVIEIAGILGPDGVVWNIKAPGGDIPWDFMADFLRKSRETEPYLWPVRKHDEMGWQDSEHLCTLSTDLLIHSPEGWAEKAAGPYSARLTTSLDLVMAYFGVEA